MNKLALLAALVIGVGSIAVAADKQKPKPGDAKPHMKPHMAMKHKMHHHHHAKAHHMTHHKMAMKAAPKAPKHK
jgi:hypothetical protein